jgi:hypothetical protein
MIIFWASPHEDVGSLRSGTRWSLGPIGLASHTLRHPYTSLMQCPTKKDILEYNQLA